MCPSPRHRLVLVASAADDAAAAAIRALEQLSIPPPDRATDAVLRSWVDPTGSGPSVPPPLPVDHSATSTDAAVAWALPEAADVDLDRFYARAGAAGWDVVGVVVWQPPEQVATTAPSPWRAAEALARWELANHRILTGLQGRAAVVVEEPAPSPGAAGLEAGASGTLALAGAVELFEAIGGPASPPGPASPAETGSPHETGSGPTPEPTAAPAPPKRRRRSSLPGADEVLAAQQALAGVLRAAAGTHRSLAVTELPEPSGWAVALEAAQQRARQATAEATGAWRHAAARGQDAEVLWQALWQVGDQLADTVASALPPPAIPPYGPDATGDQHGYRAWIAQRETPAAPPGSAAANPAVAGGPLISVVVPIYKPDLGLLRAAVSSVQRQSYHRWELCLCDDGSGDPAVSAALAGYAGADHRIKVTALPANGGISAATNGALGLAGGEWVAFMDQDDELAAGALEAVAAAVVDDPTIDLVYTDDDKIDREGRRFGPQFKPDWSPDLLLSMCYFSHLVAMRRSLVDEVGGLRSAFDGGQDWDLALRVSERARTIHHIPQVLYHWRAIPGSAALDSSYKPWAYEAARRALLDALERRGEAGTVDHHPRFRGLYHVRRELTGQPLVSIVIPFRDGAGLLQRCVDSLVVEPGYDRFELVLVDNGSTEPELLALLDRLSGDDRVTIVRDPRPFNWAALNNAAINRCSGDMILTLNNDITASSPGWLRELVSHAQRPAIGAVGARLLYPDGRVQHVGAAIGLGGIVAHPMRGLPGDHPGYMGFATVIRNWSAVTGACLLARRQVVEDVGGFDEQLAVAFNDVDFCLKVIEAGYRIVFTPLAEMIHAESSTRGFTGYGADIEPFVTRWADWLQGEDPMFSPHLSRLDARCVVRLADEDPQWAALLARIGLTSLDNTEVA